MILVIDNYDSFTYNLVQYIGILDPDVKVIRNDVFDISEIIKLSPDKIIISPGPGYPQEAGLLLDIIKTFYKTCPIFGVCLGMQAIGHAFGGKIVSARELVHGKQTLITHDKKTIFKNIQNPLYGGRYHSLVVERASLPSCFQISAQTEEGEIMGLRLKDYPVEGVQFHPESILTKQGPILIKNFINYSNEYNYQFAE